MPTGNMAASLFSPEDIYWGNLAGCLESIDAGTTLVVDHAHMNYSPEHNSMGSPPKPSDPCPLPPPPHPILPCETHD